MNAMVATPGFDSRSPAGGWHACHRAETHGSHCSCRALAAAVGIEPSALDYRYCVSVLQRHWRMTCDHIPRAAQRVVTPTLPPHDPHDPVHLALLANADLSSD